MVGVPGRSRGCNTCIQRKVKCDQRTPQCGNCLKSRRLCAGYARQTAFVFSADVEFQNGEIQTLNQDETTFTCQGRWKAGIKGVSPSSGIIATAKSRFAFAKTTGVSIMPHLPPHISQSAATWEQLRSVYIDMYMPQDSFTKAATKSDITGNWILQLQGEVVEATSLQLSLAACATAELGRDSNDPDLLSKARDMYVKSLEHMRGDLCHRKSRLSDQTLAACMALSTYALFDAVGDETCNFDAHLKGAMALLQMRGPDAMTSPLAHSLFLGLRRHSILGSLVHHQETFLSSPQWHTRPWSVYSKNPVDRCLDALFMLPAVQRIWDNVRYATDADHILEECNNLVQESMKIHIALHEWLDDFRDSIAGPTYWPEFSTLKGTSDGYEPTKLFPISFHFPAFTVCFQMTTFWSGMMVVHDLLMNAFEKLATVDTGHVSSARKHEQVWITMIQNICQSVEYCEKSENRKVGLAVALSIMRGCYFNLLGYPDRWEAERAWTMQMIERISQKLNISRAK